MIAVSAARIYGPEHAATPEGHPILLMTPPFDTTIVSPVRAMAEAAEKRFGILIPSIAGDLTLGTIWKITAEYKVIIPENRTSLRPKHQALYLFEYLPEQILVADKVAKGMKPIRDEFANSWYLKRIGQ